MSLLRTIVFWLAMVSLPLQGLAAVVRLHCATPSHPASGVTHGHAAHDHAAHVMHHVESAGVADLVEATALADAIDNLDGDPTDPSCSACAACSGLAALPDAPSVRLALGPGDALPQAPPSDPLRFETDGPDRPPRTSIA